jgi:hypothetical protein
VALVDNAVRPVLEAADRGLEARDLLLLGDPLLLAPDELELARDGVGGVVAGPHADPPALELGDLRHGLVEQVAVVGDDQHRAREARDELLDGPPPLDVEVRLGLVEQQDVRRADQARGERDELALSAAQLGGRAPEVGLAQAEVAQVADRVALEAVGAERLAALEQRRLALDDARHAVEVRGQRRVGELRLDPRQVALERRELGARVADRLAHGARVARDELRQVRDDRAAAERDGARVGLVRARQHAEQRRLARAVGADQADPRPGRQLQVEPVEDAAPAERLHDAARAERGGGGGGAHGHGDANLRAATYRLCVVNPTRCGSVARP